MYLRCRSFGGICFADGKLTGFFSRKTVHIEVVLFLKSTHGVFSIIAENTVSGSFQETQRDERLLQFTHLFAAASVVQRTFFISKSRRENLSA